MGLILIFRLQKNHFLNRTIKILLAACLVAFLLPVCLYGQEQPKEKEVPKSPIKEAPKVKEKEAPAATENKEKSEFPLDHFYVKRHKRIVSILHNFHFGLSLGYGSTTFKHDLTGFSIYQAKGEQPSIFSGTNSSIRYSNWVNDVVIDSSASKPGSHIYRSDSTKIGFKGKAWNIPLKLTVHYEFGGRYRIGAGYSYEYMSIGTFQPTSLSGKVNDFKLANPSGLMRKYFLILGAAFYRIDEYLFIGDVNIGNFKPKSNFNPAFVKPAMYYNVGVTIERDFSEYLKGFIRPSYEIKSYDLALPESSKAIHHTMNALYVNIGLTYSIPPMPRCFLKDCHIQINHAHGNKEYRSRRHSLFKKQNPGYGENYPKLIKYKGKNKNKLNPY